MTVPINTVAITNIDAKVWTCKSEFPPGDFLHFLTQPEITWQRNFELTDIEYDLINYEIVRIKCIEYNTDTRRNVMNVDKK